MKTAPVPIAPPQSRISNVIIHGFMPLSGATSAGTEFAEVSEYPAVLPAAIVPEESGVPALPEETAVLPVGTEELPAAAGELPAGVWVLPGMVVPAPVVDGPGFAVVAVSLALRIRSLSAFTKSSSVFMVTVCDSLLPLNE